MPAAEPLSRCRSEDRPSSGLCSSTHSPGLELEAPASRRWLTAVSSRHLCGADPVMSEPSGTVQPFPKPGLLPGEARGYTLLELIVVLLILGAAAALVAPSVGSLLWRSRLDQATERAAALLHDARAAAARSGRSVTVELSADRRELRGPTDTPRLVPPPPLAAAR